MGNSTFDLESYKVTSRMALFSENFISAADALTSIIAFRESVKLLDVRSEGEFQQGSIPHSLNVPILRDHERHQVGLCYKERGQESAIELGMRLVAPDRNQRVAQWVDSLKHSKQSIVTCWRGGLRSKIAAEWLHEAGVSVTRVRGGYKALRQEFTKAFEQLPPLLIIAGPTGSGKSLLLKSLTVPVLDLEQLAAHRGSAFGRLVNVAQPSQANFENQIGFVLLANQGNRIVVEDESLVIGQVHLPMSLKNHMSRQPVVKLTMNFDERVSHILDDYILQPMKLDISPQILLKHYEQSLNCIHKKLGGLLAQKIHQLMMNAFANHDLEGHRCWIRELLVHYYDKLYEFSFNKTPRQVVFEGDRNACQQWIQDQFA